MSEQINIGIVGAVGRGRSFRSACHSSGALNIHAVCDIDEENLEGAREKLGAAEKYTSYDEMLEKSNLQAVIIGTPMPLHVPQSIQALKKNLHVLSEVPAGISVEECKQLVLACKESNAKYMMAENYTYTKPNCLIKELVRKGLFGEVYYAEGEYLHELKGLGVKTPWRRHWQNGINGITYGTHSLGPILQWFEGDRVSEVTCAGSGFHVLDPDGKHFEAEDTCVMLCKTEKNRLIKIRVDMISDRPHAMNNHQLQGTDGCYESGRSKDEKGKIWLRSLSKEEKWMELSELEADYLPENWRSATDVAKKSGHGGGDYFEVIDFLDTITGKKPCPIGIHETMDMTLPGLISQESIQKKGKWLPVPDSRDW